MSSEKKNLYVYVDQKASVAQNGLVVRGLIRNFGLVVMIKVFYVNALNSKLQLENPVGSGVLDNVEVKTFNKPYGIELHIVFTHYFTEKISVSIKKPDNLSDLLVINPLQHAKGKLMIPESFEELVDLRKFKGDVNYVEVLSGATTVTFETHMALYEHIDWIYVKENLRPRVKVAYKVNPEAPLSPHEKRLESWKKIESASNEREQAECIAEMKSMEAQTCGGKSESMCSVV